MKKKKTHLPVASSLISSHFVCMCVCVCVGQRKRERDSSKTLVAPRRISLITENVTMHSDDDDNDNYLL